METEDRLNLTYDEASKILTNAFLQFVNSNGIWPSIRDIKDVTKWSSTSVVFFWLKQMKAKGLVEQVYPSKRYKLKGYTLTLQKDGN